MLKTDIKKDFLDLFYNEINDFVITGLNVRLNLHILKIESNQFAYSQLVDKLFHCVVPFCLSKKEVEQYQNNFGIFTKAVQKLRDYKSNDGEMGEILLYCLLESQLEAPKIFTKLELKTSSNDYVKGSDGVHLLKLDERNFQLVFGESKLRKDLQDGLFDAFKSINEFLTRPNNNINHEIGLLNTHLEREAMNDELYQFLKTVILPSASDDEVYRDNAFGVFVGFDLKLDSAKLAMPNHQFRAEVRKTIREAVEKEISYIEKKIKDYKLQGHAIYIYVVPFTDLDKTRKRVIQNLKGAQNDF